MLSLGERSSVTYDGLAGTTERIVGGHGKLGSGDAWQPIVARPADVYHADRVNGAAFARRIRRHPRRTRQEFRLDQAGGKGSHGKLYLGDRRTIVKHGEIPKPLLKSMLKQLGVAEEDL